MALPALLISGSLTTTVAQSPGIHWAAGATAIATSVTALGVIFAGAGAVWAGKQVKEAERTRHATAAIEVASRWESDALVGARREVKGFANSEALRDAYLEAKRAGEPRYYVLQRLPDFFEDLGVMERMGGLGIEWIWLTLGSATLEYWRFWGPTIQAVREGQPTMGENFERLAQRLSDWKAKKENAAGNQHRRLRLKIEFR